MPGIAAKLIDGSTHAEQLVNAPSEQDTDSSITADLKASPQDSGQHAASMVMDAEESVPEDRRPAIELTLPSGNVCQLTVSPRRPLADKTK